MNIKELIKSYRHFYHITDSAYETSIMEKGLIPKIYERMDYHIECPEVKAQVCVTPPRKLHELYKSFQSNDSSINYIIFEISAEYISSINFGLDWTFAGTAKLYKMDILDGIKKSIEEFGTLACFDIIPNDVIRKYDLQNPYKK